MDRVALVGQLFVAYQSGDFGNFAELVSPNVRLEPVSTDLTPGPTYEGAAGIAEWARELADSDDEFQPAVESIEAVGDRVLAVGSIQVAGPGGLRGPTPAAWLCDFDESGRLLRMRTYVDVDQAWADAKAPPGSRG
jgi:ketosteroid isomerase-like protein